MRTRLTGAPVETAQDGFLQLPSGAGLGISVNEAALAEYREREA
jgi:L-alanine-DL-glutamate epimerase-like enolase superfamily enzyme